MPIAEIFVSAFITVLFEKLASGELLKLARLGGIDDKLKKWRKNLEIIDTLLGDAEEKQVTQRTVLHWLEDLRDLAYEIDDVLDELTTEVLHRKLTMLSDEHESSSSNSKVWKLIPTCCVSFTPSAVLFDIRISSKIDEITSRLDDLKNRKSDLMLIQNVKGRSDNIEERSRTTTSLVVESRVWGREEDKAAMLRLLLEDNTDNHTDEVCVLPIVGMGGLGKTTLAQLVYNDEQVKVHFDLTAWLCVSEDFDLLRMTSTIYHSLAEESKEFKDLNSVQVCLKKKLSGKKFLIVLDDVWNENYTQWDLFRAPFLVGAPGSSIIVTTRIASIAQFTGTSEAHHLRPLSEMDCLSLIAQHALRRPNFDKHPDLKDVGEEIAKKCKGLPLAAKTLGGLLCSKVSLKQWKDVLNNKVWDLPGGNNDIIPALRLSYHHLPPHLKHLFAYCSIFPRDYQFDVQDLILLWMAEGFLKQSRRKQMEELGLEYFHELLSRSFFQRFGNNDSVYVMHDLMNELAKVVAGEICFRLDEKMEIKEPYKVRQNSRHASFIRGQYDAFKKFKAFEGVRTLRTFLPLSTYEVNSWPSCHLSSMVLKELLPQFRCLRILSLSGYENISKVPNSIGDLKHLRYLNFSNTTIEEVPDSVSELHNLQALLLRGCHKLFRLPKRIRNLLNLRHLDIADTRALKQMPFGFGMLTTLRTLSKVVIDDKDGLKLSELKGLEDLQGRLIIDRMQNVKNVQDAAAADLSGKQGIKELTIRWGWRWSLNSDDSQGEGLESEVLELLKPQEGLASLEIESYCGTKFPSWVGNLSFSSMVHLTLRNCRKCTSLPSLGCLPSLKELFIEGMDGVKVIGADFLGVGLPGVSAFSSLETLSFQGMAGWEEWSTNLANGDKYAEGVFPCLGKLKISSCPNLIKVSLPLTPSLEEFKLRRCNMVVLRSIISVGSIKTLWIDEISGLTQLDEGAIQLLGALEDLKVEFCFGMKYLWQEDVACHVFTALRSLSVKYCSQLISLGEKEQVLPHNLELLELKSCGIVDLMPSCCKSLKKLSIDDCNKLQYLSLLKSEDHQTLATPIENSRVKHTEGFPNIQVLEIQRCSGLTWLPTGKKVPTSLKSLAIATCMNLKEPEEDDMKSSLESVFIYNWANLKSIPKGVLFDSFHLTRMAIVCCGVESFPKRCFPTSLTYLTISNCLNLKYLCDDDQMMQSLVSLQDLTITDCKHLESFPDGIWPPNMKYLQIGGLKKLITEWGLHRLPTSLVSLCFTGKIPELVSFSQVECHLHTTSLKCLLFSGNQNLETLSGGFHNLTSLEVLYIASCIKLRSLPEMLLPNLSSLVIHKCPGIENLCEQGGYYWPFVSHIPHVDINGRLMWGL